MELVCAVAACSPSCVVSMQVFSAAAALMARTKAALFLLGYVSRAAIIDASLSAAARKCGFDLAEVPGTRAAVGGGLEGWVYTARWLPLND